MISKTIYTIFYSLTRKSKDISIICDHVWNKSTMRKRNSSIFRRQRNDAICFHAMHLSRPMGKPTICKGENKGADQLRSNCEADQRLCFRCSDSTIPLLLKSEISSFKLFSVLVQAGLCRTCSETTVLVFPRGGSYNVGHCCHPMLHRRVYNSTRCSASSLLDNTYMFVTFRTYVYEN